MGTIAQLCRATSLQLRHLLTIGKNLLSSNICSTCPDNMVNFGPLAAEMSGSLGHPSKFQRVSRLGSVTVATSLNGSQPSFGRCLAVSWAGTLYTIYTFSGALAPLRNFVWCKIHFAFKSCALLFWQCYCTALH